MIEIECRVESTKNVVLVSKNLSVCKSLQWLHRWISICAQKNFPNKKNDQRTGFDRDTPEEHFGRHFLSFRFDDRHKGENRKGIHNIWAKLTFWASSNNHSSPTNPPMSTTMTNVCCINTTSNFWVCGKFKLRFKLGINQWDLPSSVVCRSLFILSVHLPTEISNGNAKFFTQKDTDFWTSKFQRNNIFKTLIVSNYYQMINPTEGEGENYGYRATYVKHKKRRVQWSI